MSGPTEYSPQERQQLLQLAHDSIAAEFSGAALNLEPPSPHLAEARGAFTTLHLRGALRGCVGFVLPITSLYQTVAETARAAAFEDSRFPLVTQEEAPHLQVEISVLSRPQPIAPADVEIGRHGLVITLRQHRGLLLPQVPLEHQWDRTTFLEQTCRKAGLPRGAWQQEGVRIEGFTAEVFGDMEPEKN